MKAMEVLDFLVLEMGLITMILSAVRLLQHDPIMSFILFCISTVTLIFSLVVTNAVDIEKIKTHLKL
jgi:hypothetical protein